MQISLLHLNISVFPDTYDEDHLARKPDKPSNSIAFSPQTRVYFLFIRFIPADSHSATLKTSLEICFTVGWKRHVSPPFPFSVSLSLSLFTFLPLSMSHQECHQPPLRLMPVNMAALLSARSLLLSPLFALTLDEFIKRKKKRNGRKQLQIMPLRTIDCASLAERVFVFRWCTKCVFARVILHIYHFCCHRRRGPVPQPLTAVCRSVRTQRDLDSWKCIISGTSARVCFCVSVFIYSLYLRQQLQWRNIS